MISVRKSTDRGRARHGWLDSFHSFSFADYRDPRHMGFRSLRVINEDRVQPGQGFGAHSHRDMEILTWVLEGALEHRDSLGNGSVLRPGTAQRMSAGTGVTHSEYNASEQEPVHFLQIWVLPERAGIVPSWEEKHFPASERRGRLQLLASRGGRDGSIQLHQDVDVFGALIGEGESVEHALRPGRGAWVQVARGSCELNGVRLETGDGAAVQSEAVLRLTRSSEAEILLFDLA